tara:strand:+ start:1653 stop:1865 length:213 start_codon:yes stop_codon:yes gene_type:complete
MANKKADPVMVRIGFSDVIVTKEQSEDNDYVIVGEDTFVVGYEDEDGEECDESGVYLHQPVDPNQLKADL